MRYLILFGVLAALVVAYTFYWFSLAAQIESEAADWAAARAAEGYAVSYDSLLVEGYPYRVETRIEAPRVDYDGPLGRFAWRGTTLIANVQPYRLNHIIFRAIGPQHIAIAPDPPASSRDAIISREPRAMQLLTETARASLLLDSEGISLVSVDIEGAVLTPDNGTPSSAARIQFHIRRSPAEVTGEQGIDIAIYADEAVVPALERTGLGATVEHIALDIGVRGPLPQEATWAGVDAWRDDGGTIEVARADLRWDRIEAAASGTFAIDAQARPLGSFTAQLKGHDRIVDALATLGYVSPSNAKSVKQALWLLEAATSDGDGLTVPLTLQDGKAYLGPAPLGDVPPLY